MFRFHPLYFPKKCLIKNWKIISEISYICVYLISGQKVSISSSLAISSSQNAIPALAKYV
jgi:hypothetical protein